MLKKVLLPLDGSDLAAGILPYVSLLARGLGASVTLITVVEPGYLATRVLDSVKTEIKDRLQSVVDDLKRQGVEADSRVEFGRATEVIVSVAEKEDFGLVAMSTHGRNVLARGILGSVTDRVAHHSRVPVMTITPAEARKYWQDGMAITTAVVPLDGSVLAEKALPYAEEVGRSLSLNIVLTRTIEAFQYAAPMAMSAVFQPDAMDEEMESEASAYLTRVAEGLSARGLSASWRLLRGSAAKAVVDLAQGIPQSIVIISTHGRSGLSRWLMGSVTEKVVRYSGHPVLIVPAGSGPID